MANAPDLPVASGAALDAMLGLVEGLGVHVNVLMPLRGVRVESPAVTATVRTAWVRVGPRLRFSPGELDLSAALLAGPAVTWATAVARAPRLGTAAASPGAVVSASVMLEYPRTGLLFARASASGSALLPGVRIELWSGEPRPRGAWPIEGTVGLGARWGR
jgi:hypothetical protein